LAKKATVILLAAAFMALVFPVAAGADTFYSVQPKDTLWSISKKFGVSVEEIVNSNAGLSADKGIRAGESLVIPDRTGEAIPVEEEATESQTLILHGAGGQSYPPAEQAVNVMTVDGKSIRVPVSKAVRKAQSEVRDEKAAPSGYRSKYHKMSSRSMMTGSAIVKSAFRYMGTPYIFGGTTPRGFDCSGFIQYVYAQNGIKTPRMAHHQYYAGTPIRKEQLQPGDLVFFETYCPGISHVGIYIGNSNFIHASSRGYVCVSSLSQAYYQNRYRGAARY
jgi:cell wall-associated NlpC family hydrolase